MVFTYKLYKKCPELYEEKTLKYYKISQKNNMNNFPDMFFFSIERPSIIRMSVFLKLTYKFNVNPVEIPSYIHFFSIQQMILTILECPGKF